MVVKSNTRVMVSWRRSCRRRRRLNVQPGFSTSCLSTRTRTLSARSKFESGPQQGNLSSSIRISSDLQFNWPPGSAPTPCQNKFWYRTWLPNSAWAKDSHFKTLGKLFSKALTARFEPTLSYGARARRLDSLPLGGSGRAEAERGAARLSLQRSGKLQNFVCATPGESKAGAAVAIIMKDGAAVAKTPAVEANA